MIAWPSPRREFVAALLRLAPIGLAVVLQTLWVTHALRSEDPLGLVRRDWQQYLETGNRLLAGELGAIYPRVFDMPYPWLYPPYCIYATAPLALLPAAWAYVACVVTVLLTTAGALVFLRAALPAPLAAYATAAGAVFASMPFNTAMMLGQASGLLALVLAAGLWAWCRGRRFVAGLVLSLMLAKPNLGLVVAAVCVAGREWRVLGGMATGLGMMVLASLPLGLETWQDYARATRGYVPIIETRTLMWKQLTLYAFWRTLPGVGGGHSASLMALWIASVAPLAVLTLRAWWQRSRGQPVPLERAFGMTVLLAISGNLYTQFYDGLLLLVPGVLWYVGRAGYRSRAAWQVIGVCILLLFIGGHVTMFAIQGGVAWAGPVIAVWLVAEAYDLLAAPAAAHIEEVPALPAVSLLE